MRYAAQVTDVAEAVQAELQAARVLRTSLHDAGRARELVQGAQERARPASRTPHRGVAYVALFDLEREAGDSTAAAEAARRALATSSLTGPPAAALHEFLGQLAHSQGDLKAAQTGLEAALKQQPGRVPATRTLVEILAPTGAHSRIDALISEALKLAQQAQDDEDTGELDARLHAELLRRQGATLSALGRGRDAYTALLAAEDLLPGDLGQQIELGEQAFALGEHAIAAQYLGGLLSYAGDVSVLPSPLSVARLVDALDHAASAERALSQDAQARTLWRAALRLLPDHASASEHYLDLLLAEGHREDASEAQALLSRVEPNAPSPPAIRSRRCRAYLAAAEAGSQHPGDAAGAHALLLLAYAQAPASKPRPPGSEERAASAAPAPSCPCPLSRLMPGQSS